MSERVYPERTTTTFERHTATGVRTGICPVCHRHGKRQRTFARTVNPWNTNPDGTPKSRAEVAADVRADAELWSHGVFVHEKCSR